MFSSDVHRNNKMELEDIPELHITKKTEVNEEHTDFEQAISLTGFGRFHYGLILTCGACFLAAGFQNGLNAYILPSASCDLQLSSSQMGALNAVFISGSIASAYMWGALADSVGRKTIIVASLAADAVVTLLSSLSQSFTVFVMFRFLSGFISGAPASLVIPYVGEFHSLQRGTKSVCFVGFFWTLSWMLLPGVAWIVIPQQWKLRTASGFLYNSWRIFVALFAIPSALSAILLTVCFPESPKFLLAIGRPQEALHILATIFAVNNRCSTTCYPVKQLKRGTTDRVQDLHCEANGSRGTTGKSILRLLRAMWCQSRALLTPPLLSKTLLSCTLLFTNMFGYFGLGLWLPELFNRFEEHYSLHPNESVSVCELRIAIPQYENSTQHHDRTYQCDENPVNPRVFFNTLVVGAACLIANLTSGLLAGRTDTRVMPVFTMLLAGGSALAIYFLRSSTQNLIVSSVFLASIGTANFVISGVAVDLFPTNLRAMAICCAILAGRVGAVASNIVFGSLLDISCAVPIFLLGGVCIVGGLLGFLIPPPYASETK